MKHTGGTEDTSLHDELEQRSTLDLLQRINQEDQKLAQLVKEALPAIQAVVNAAHQALSQDGRLFYMGAGTSGRLGILDASECPPTFGVPPNRVIGLIAGGDAAIRLAVEGAEDDVDQGFLDLLDAGASTGDVVVGISSSGTTPYVLGALRKARLHGLITAGIACNAGAPLSDEVDHPIEICTGPEFVTGSTRMKAGTATKMVLNMISTSCMIKLGHVKGNKMVDMQLSNAKLVRRGTRMICQLLGWDEQSAREALLEQGSVRAVIDAHRNK